MARRRIVLLGATGFTGNRVLRALLAAGGKPTLMGRNSARMAAIRPSARANHDSHGDPYLLGVVVDWLP